MPFTRRDFLATAAVGGLASQLPGQTSEPWFDKPMRWAQLTLAENDPGRYDLGFWLDYFKRIHADAVCLSAGGVVAYYPTEIPLHHKSAWMGNTDPFGELLAGCRKLGVSAAVARVDPHAVHQDVYDAHPDWIAVDASGQKRRHWGSPEMWVTCALGPYNPVFLTAVMKEIATKYKVDALFANRWDGSGMCYCEHCQTLFRAASGRELPRKMSIEDPSFRDYHVWKEKRLFDQWRLWDKELRAINPNITMIPNTGGGALSTPDMKETGELAQTLFADNQARHGVMAPWANGKNAKEYRAVMGRKAVVGIYSVGLEEPYRWKDSVQNADELKLWVADATANGARPWFTKFSGIIYDRRWLKTIEDIYGWHYRNERYLRNEESLARVGLVYSQQTAQFYGGEQARAKVEDPIQGFYQALVEARVPFEMVHDGLLDAAHLARLKTLILPNVAALSAKQCDQIRAFVARGGGLIATNETSLYDEWGVRRMDF
ncbi:MAG: alpha-amylase family protein, partial [Bryobacteraceae bacterium]